MLPLIDIALVPFVLVSGIILKGVRRIGVGRLPMTKASLLKVGVFPIRDHYYEPMFNPRHLRYPLEQDRVLSGIDWNLSNQLSLLDKLNYSLEIQDSWKIQAVLPEFCIDNGSYESGDAEYWYSVIRHFKPRKIIEIGSGYSTLIARMALKKNSAESSTQVYEHLCIEPYEQPWLEATGVKVSRNRVEDIGLGVFTSLDENDILFIDSSHIIRPQGDVLFEFLEILPCLKKGVIVHIHDIFSPRDYSSSAIVGDVLFWNEQYLLEAFLTNNNQWKIIGAVNFLKKHYYDQLKMVCPFLLKKNEPGSFYIQKIA